MTQYPDPNSPPSSFSPTPGYAPGYAPPPRAQVVHVVAKPGGFWRAVGIVAALALFAVVFFFGLGAGILIVVAGSAADSVVFHETYRKGGPSEVAVIPVEGIIDGQQAEFVRDAVNDVLKNGDVSAVVLRVDSPGGEVNASDQIWYEIKRLKDRGFPVIASYGGVAASGGYYISCGTDHIMAEETCITGSIGVIAQVLTFEGLLDKVGVQPVTLVATGSPEKSVANDVFRSWNDQDKEKVRIMLDSAYATFIKRVQDGRKTVLPEPAQLNGVANGSIYTAQQAKDNGLVDSIGYLDDAIAVAEARAGVTPGSSKVFIIRQPPTLMAALTGAQARDRSITSLDGEAVRSFVNDLASPRVMYLMH